MSEIAAMSMRWKVLMTFGTTVREKATVKYSKVSMRSGTKRSSIA
jgi:hypothetical protein